MKKKRSVAAEKLSCGGNLEEGRREEGGKGGRKEGREEGWPSDNGSMAAMKMWHALVACK